jgi:hypothetical protein
MTPARDARNLKAEARNLSAIRALNDCRPHPHGRLTVSRPSALRGASFLPDGRFGWLLNGKAGVSADAKRVIVVLRAIMAALVVHGLIWDENLASARDLAAPAWAKGGFARD